MTARGVLLHQSRVRVKVRVRVRVRVRVTANTWLRGGVLLHHMHV